MIYGYSLINKYICNQLNLTYCPKGTTLNGNIREVLLLPVGINFIAFLCYIVFAPEPQGELV